jgi:hypothetical protein
MTDISNLKVCALLQPGCLACASEFDAFSLVSCDPCMPRDSVCVLPAQYAPGPPAVGYDPIKSVEWALGSVQQQGERPQRGKQPYPWEPQVPSDPQDALPVWGVKQAVNSPLDFGPYKREGAELSTLSWPGQRAAPSPQEAVTLFVNDLNGAKVPIACRMGDTVESLRKQIWQKMHGQMKLIEGDDDADTRFINAAANPSNPDTRIRTVQDVAESTTVPGNAHYSRYMHVEPSSLATDRQLRKPVPIPGKYQPPLRCPQTPAELDLYIGAIKMEDGQMEFSRSLNSGAKPTYKVLTLGDFNISDGTVLRAEYTQSGAEYKMKDPDRDMNKLGATPDLDTACQRVRDTVLDPDFYVSSSEQLPRLLMEFLLPPDGDEDGPFVGRLEVIPSCLAWAMRACAHVCAGVWC